MKTVKYFKFLQVGFTCSSIDEVHFLRFWKMTSIYIAQVDNKIKLLGYTASERHLYTAHIGI